MHYAEHSIQYTCLHVEWDECCIDCLYWSELLRMIVVVVCYSKNIDCQRNIHPIQDVNMYTMFCIQHNYIWNSLLY